MSVLVLVLVLAPVLVLVLDLVLALVTGVAGYNDQPPPHSLLDAGEDG